MNDDDFISNVHKLRDEGNTLRGIARSLDLPHTTLLDRINRLGIYKPNYGWTDEGPGFEYTSEEYPEIDIDELIKKRCETFDRVHKHEESIKTRTVKITMDGPVGICHFGDLHVDDNGTNFPLIKEHIEIVNNTKGLFAACIGDLQNNWIGRLARLYGQQSTSAAESWALTEWIFKSCPWLYITLGNHDFWSGSGDPLKWIAKQQGQPYQPHSARIRLDFPNGKNIHITAKHQFPGSSVWNSVHSVSKSAQLGNWDELTIGGHRHQSGYAILKSPDGRIAHAIQLSSYKTYDEYAKQKGFKDSNISPAVVTVINPDTKEPSDLITVFHSVARGADYLTYIREKWRLS